MGAPENESDANGSIQAIEILSQPSPQRVKHTTLSAADHAIVIRDLAGTESTDTNDVSRPQLTSRIYPPYKLPDSLYSSIVQRRTTTRNRYKALSAFYNIALILQLLFGAALTALGSASSRSSKYQIALTILAAGNTVNAGLLALLHNSGLPERLKNDFREYEKVEEHVRMLLDSGIVREGWTKEDAIMDCYERYERAKDIVFSNKPNTYNKSGDGVRDINRVERGLPGTGVFRRS